MKDYHTDCLGKEGSNAQVLLRQLAELYVRFSDARNID